MNRWNIPNWLEIEVKNRDLNCVYCGAVFGDAKKTKATWEHIINDAKIVTRANIVLCCTSCNASKGAKTLKGWLLSEYCRKRGIDKNTVAQVVQDALKD